MAVLSDRAKQVITFLRHLSGGFSSYRLLDGNLEQQGFVEAVKRVTTGAETALATGNVRVRVHGDAFFFEGNPLPADDAYRRLAMACYERRVEELSLVGVPTTADLGALYEVLTTVVEEVDSRGGASLMLAKRGVNPIRLNEALVSPTESGDAEGAIPQADALTEGLEELNEIARMLVHDPHHADPTSVYRLLREVVAALPREKANHPDTYQRLREAVENLPEDVRTALSSMLIADVANEEVAERLIGSMTDTGLAQLLVDVAKQVGGDPLELARDLVVGGFRKQDLVDLAAAATQGARDPAAAAGSKSMNGAGSDRSHLMDAIRELTTNDLKSSAEEDERALREEFPSGDAYEAEALMTFSDYLRLEDNSARLQSVLETWAGATRSALQEDMTRATQLVKVADSAYKLLLVDAPDRARLISDAKGGILDEELVAELVAQGSHAEGGALLVLFGNVALDAVLQRLSHEEETARRSALIAVASGLVAGDPDHGKLQQWVTDERWFVVRNVMTILHRSGTSSEMLDAIEVGLRHPHPAVRKEAVRALGPAGAEAVPRLARLATDPDHGVAVAAIESLGSVALIAIEGGAATIGAVIRVAKEPDVRKKALEILTKHPSDDATDVLLSISKFGTKPRAPYAIRRQAKALARQRRDRS